MTRPGWFQGYLFGEPGRKPRRVRPKVLEGEEAVFEVRQLTEEPPEFVDAPAVMYVPVRCPSCGKSRRQTYGQYNRVRYHRCLDCMVQFKSFERDSS